MYGAKWRTITSMFDRMKNHSRLLFLILGVVSGFVMGKAIKVIPKI